MSRRVAAINQADSAERISQMSNVNIFGDKTWKNEAASRPNHSSLNVNESLNASTSEKISIALKH